MDKENRGLWRYDANIPGGKYLVLRRDGTVFDDAFVLGRRDPATPAALRAYADAFERHYGPDENPQYIAEIRAEADRVEKRVRSDVGDPGKGPHRKDHPLVVQQMLHPDLRILAPLEPERS